MVLHEWTLKMADNPEEECIIRKSEKVIGIRKDQADAVARKWYQYKHPCRIHEKTGCECEEYGKKVQSQKFHVVSSAFR